MSLMRTPGRVGTSVLSRITRAATRMGATQLRALGMAAVAVALVAPATAEAQVEKSVSANAGWTSQYIFRGILQKTSSASAGLDLSAGPVSVGTWLADVGEGTEVDIFGSVGFDVEEFSLRAGGTAYLYTGEFDDTYVEANINAGYGPLSYEFSIGQYENFGLGTLDYWFTGVTLAHEGFYGTVAGWGSDFSGNYGEVGYGFSAAELDFSIAGILSDSELSGQIDGAGLPTPGLTLVFGIGKTFEF
ncbi:MAG: hypothetical protein O3A25_07740 [Acidobacteria bacterium]|nr:hypothetical protein [Acidobacteriota bacterium]